MEQNNELLTLHSTDDCVTPFSVTFIDEGSGDSGLAYFDGNSSSNLRLLRYVLVTD